VLYFSQETDAERLLEFMASNRSGIDVWRLRHNLYGVDHEQVEAEYAEAVAQIGGYRDLLLINDNFVDLPKLVAKAQNAAQQYSRNCHPVGIVLVDYAQIIEPGHATRDLRTGTVEVVRGLHQLSYRLRVPVVVASQVTTAHKEIDQKPHKEHLAESPGALVAAADKIIMVHNPPHGEGVDPAAPRPTTFSVEKHKRGRTGVVHGMFYGTMQRFTEERL
jgi:replicative DNA helicase